VLLLGGEEEVELRDEVVVDEGGDAGRGGGEDGGIVDVFLGEVGVDEVEEELHAGEADVVLGRLQDLPHQQRH
jgi:hypothetical protein